MDFCDKLQSNISTVLGRAKGRAEQGEPFMANRDIRQRRVGDLMVKWSHHQRLGPIENQTPGRAF